MSHDRWNDFVEWLAANEILTTVDDESIPDSELPGDLYTNELLPNA